MKERNKLVTTRKISFWNLVVLMNTNWFVLRQPCCAYNTPHGCDFTKYYLSSTISTPTNTRKCLRLGELGDGLGALGHGVLGKLAREHKSHTGLHLAGGQSGFLVVEGQAAGFAAQTLEHVLDERVHDGHSFLGDAGVGVHLLQHLEDVCGVALRALLLARATSGFAAGFSFLGGTFNHFDVRETREREIEKCAG